MKPGYYISEDSGEPRVLHIGFFDSRGMAYGRSYVSDADITLEGEALDRLTPLKKVSIPHIGVRK